jgi:hypothetical protein
MKMWKWGSKKKKFYVAITVFYHDLNIYDGKFICWRTQQISLLYPHCFYESRYHCQSLSWRNRVFVEKRKVRSKYGIVSFKHIYFGFAGNSRLPQHTHGEMGLFQHLFLFGKHFSCSGISISVKFYFFHFPSRCRTCKEGRRVNDRLMWN